jgi:hypothetical protein
MQIRAFFRVFHTVDWLLEQASRRHSYNGRLEQITYEAVENYMYLESKLENGDRWGVE